MNKKWDILKKEKKTDSVLVGADSLWATEHHKG
jgi:hypothetical protein